MVCGGRRSGRWMSVCMLLDEPPRDSLGSARERSAKIGSALRPPTPARDLSNTSFNNQIGFLHANGRSRWDLVRVRVSAVPGISLIWRVYTALLTTYSRPTYCADCDWPDTVSCLVSVLPLSTSVCCLDSLHHSWASRFSSCHPSLVSFTLNSYLLTKVSLSMYKLFKGFPLYWQHSWLYIETTLLHPLISLVIKYNL